MIDLKEHKDDPLDSRMIVKMEVLVRDNQMGNRGKLGPTKAPHANREVKYV